MNVKLVVGLAVIVLKVLSDVKRWMLWSQNLLFAFSNLVSWKCVGSFFIVLDYLGFWICGVMFISFRQFSVLIASGGLYDPVSASLGHQTWTGPPCIPPAAYPLLCIFRFALLHSAFRMLHLSVKQFPSAHPAVCYILFFISRNSIWFSYLLYHFLVSHSPMFKHVLFF